MAAEPASLFDRLVRPAVVALAALFACGIVWPWAAALFVAAASLAPCAVALARRPSRGLQYALALVAVWLVGGLVGALALRGEPLGGLGFVLIVLFALPLPIVPWLYARTFKGPRR